MNKERRARIVTIQEAMNEGQSPDIEEVRSIAADEREAFDALPENMQSGEKGSRMTEVADALESAADAFEQARDELESALRDALE